MTNANFKAWHAQADIPAQRDGKWVDLETGHEYNPAIDYTGAGSRRAPARSLSDKAQGSRDVAKAHGGRALTGTAKQKEWAEKIRAEKLAGMSADQAALACNPDGLARTAKFWIDNRARSAADIAGFLADAKALRAEFDAARSAGNADAARAKAAAYNALTAAWGFQ